MLNKHLQQFMPGLTAKVFRTYNASFTFQEELKKTDPNGTVAEKVLAYNRANRQVAVLCNHQRAVPKTHGTQMEKLGDKILAVKYERQMVKEQILELEPSFRKKREDLTREESDLDEEFITRHLISLDVKEEERLEKVMVKENEKRVAEGEEPLKRSESKDKKVTLLSLERLEKKLVTLTERIVNHKMALVDKVLWTSLIIG